MTANLTIFFKFPFVYEDKGVGEGNKEKAPNSCVSAVVVFVTSSQVLSNNYFLIFSFFLSFLFIARFNLPVIDLNLNELFKFHALIERQY